MKKQSGFKIFSLLLFLAFLEVIEARGVVSHQGNLYDIHVSLAIHGGYVPEKYSTANTKISIFNPKIG